MAVDNRNILKIRTSYRKNKNVKYLIENLTLKMRERYLVKLKKVLKLKVYMNKENLFVKNAQIMEIQYLVNWKGCYYKEMISFQRCPQSYNP